MTVPVDLNCDMGESFGAYRLGTDEAILPWVTSANIACGFHAGDPGVMRRTVRAALAEGVAVGAHPGLPDLAGFGRRAMQISADEAFEMVVYQVGALEAFVRAEGGTMAHVKPHGALYNMAAVDGRLADAIADAVRAVNPALVLVGLSGSELIRAGERAGLATASEVFADRTYQPDGTLTPRLRPGAMIGDVDGAVRQVLELVQQQRVRAVDGTEVAVRAETVCLHGDGARALELAQAIRQGLEAAAIAVAPLRRLTNA